MEQQKRIIIKATIENSDEIRRFATESANFGQICDTIKQIFSINAPFSIKYKDNEGDLLIISNDLELKEAICLSQPLRIFISLSNNPIPKFSEPQQFVLLSTDEKQKTTVDNSNKTEKQCHWKRFWKNNPEMKESREQIQATKLRVFAARDKVITAKKELMAAREDLFTIKKKLWEKIRIAREKKLAENPSSTENTDIKCPNKVFSRFVKHVTFPEGSELHPCREFIKAWRVRNEANKSWPVNTKLQFVGKSEEDRLTDQASYDAGTLAPGQEKDISIPMKTPTKPGRYISFWRFYDPENKLKFGQRLCAQVNVVDSSNSSSSSSEEDTNDKVYTELLKQLHDMGFTNEKKNKRILKRFNGNLNLTVQALVKQINDHKC